MPTNSGEAILRAAHRARRDAEHHLAEGDTEAAEALFKAIANAESELRGATARIRQSIRPLSVSGFGESHDRLNDVIDSLCMTVERLGSEADDDDEDVDDAEDAWDVFVDAHPELTAPTAFTDQELLSALRTAIEKQELPWLQGAACSSDVAVVLAPEREPRQGHNLAVRIGKALARLSREGQVVRLRRKWTHGRGGSIWTFEGYGLADYWLKGYEFEANDA